MLKFFIIGVPDGFESHGHPPEESASMSKIDFKIKGFNLNRNSEVLLVFREQRISKGEVSFYFVLCRYATEMNPRSGSYYGSVIILENAIAKPRMILSALYELADVVKNHLLTPESKFKGRIESFSFKTPDSVKQLDRVKETYNPQILPNTHKDGFVFIKDEVTSYEDFLTHFYNNDLLADYRNIYASSSEDVFNSVRENKKLSVLSLSLLEQNRQERFKKEQDKEEIRIADEKAKKETEFKENTDNNLGFLRSDDEYGQELDKLLAKLTKNEETIKELRKINSEQSQKIEELNTGIWGMRMAIENLKPPPQITLPKESQTNRDNPQPPVKPPQQPNNNPVKPPQQPNNNKELYGINIRYLWAGGGIFVTVVAIFIIYLFGGGRTSVNNISNIQNNTSSRNDMRISSTIASDSITMQYSTYSATRIGQLSLKEFAETLYDKCDIYKNVNTAKNYPPKEQFIQEVLKSVKENNSDIKEDVPIGNTPIKFSVLKDCNIKTGNGITYTKIYE